MFFIFSRVFSCMFVLTKYLKTLNKYLFKVNISEPSPRCWSRKLPLIYPLDILSHLKRGLRAFNIFDMTRENEKPSEQAVMTAMAKFLSELWDEEDFRDQPEHLSEIFETILVNEIGDDLDLRIKMVSFIRTSKLLANTLGSFTDMEINNACQKIMNA